MKNFTALRKLIDDLGCALSIVKWVKQELKQGEKIRTREIMIACKLAYLMGLETISSAKPSLSIDVIKLMLKNNQGVKDFKDTVSQVVNVLKQTKESHVWTLCLICLSNCLTDGNQYQQKFVLS